MRKALLTLIIMAVAALPLMGQPASDGMFDRLTKSQRKFAEHRFGMFICYNIMSYGARWGQWGYPIDSFNPQKLDCNQWADAAVSAGMTYGLLTTKHHEGFCLWDTKTTAYGVMGTEYKQDVVRKFVDAFRKKNLAVGLYYSTWDATHDLNNKNVTPRQMKLMKEQLTELLTNYGKIDFLFFDGWYWKTGQNGASFQEIRRLIRKLQPDCLVCDNTHLQAYWRNDYIMFEGPFGAYPPKNNTKCSSICDLLVGGNGWFWGNKTPRSGCKSPQKLAKKIKDLESKYCSFMLACLPNRDGLLDPNQVEALAKIGPLWKPDTSRPPLPKQPKRVIYSVQPAAATASSGDPSRAVDGKMAGAKYTSWKTKAGFPQHVTIDLGKVWAGLDTFSYVPAHRMKPERSIKEGNITSYRLLSSLDNKNFTLISKGTWDADGNMQSAIFPPCTARYMKLEVLEANGKFVEVEEFDIGSWAREPVCQEPQANNQTLRIEKGKELEFALDTVSPNGQELEVQLVSTPKQGTLEQKGPHWVFKSSTIGPDSFSYKVTNGKYESELATVSIEVLDRPLPSGEGAGGLTHQVWENLKGKNLKDLTGNARYPDKPSTKALLKALHYEAYGKRYGSLIQGYIHPPVTADYTFKLSSDEAATVTLSEDETPAKGKIILEAASKMRAGTWNTTKAPIRLEAGKRYYIEILHKQEGEDDRLSVMWSIPGYQEAIIQGAYLSPLK